MMQKIASLNFCTPEYGDWFRGQNLFGRKTMFYVFVLSMLIHRINSGKAGIIYLSLTVINM